MSNDLKPFASYYGRPVIKQPVWHSPDIPGYLFLGGLARDLAREPAAAGEERLDRPLVGRGAPRRHRHPVADRRELVAPVGQVSQPSPDPRQDLAVRRADPVDFLVLEGDPAGHGPLGIRRERLRERIVPAQGAQPILGHASV